MGSGTCKIKCCMNSALVKKSISQEMIKKYIDTPFTKSRCVLGTKLVCRLSIRNVSFEVESSPYFREGKHIHWVSVVQMHAFIMSDTNPKCSHLILSFLSWSAFFCLVLIHANTFMKYKGITFCQG